MAFQLRLPRALYEAMLAQAVSELPNECCGLFAGRLLTEGCQSIARVQRRYPLGNSAASPTEYLSAPRDMFDAVRDMRRLNLDIVAVYHSHPASAAVPSRTDLERNYSSDVINFIVSLRNLEPLVQGWWLGAQEFQEADWLLVDK